MSQAPHLIANKAPGYGSSKGRYLPCAGVSASPCSPFGIRRSYSHFSVGSIKCASRPASLVCNVSSGGHRRNSDFSRQTRPGFSVNRNRQSEDRDTFENLDNSDLLTSRNGSLDSSNPKSQANASPGPREKEIVELFRKVQAQLRERAAAKEEKKVEASQGKSKENETVDSLLKLLRKHSIEQGKKKINTVDSGNSTIDEPEQFVSRNGSKSSSFSNQNKRGKNIASEPKAPSLTRPPSNFRRRSPVTQVKFQPSNSREEPVGTTSNITAIGRKKKQFEMLPDANAAQHPELEIELEQDEEPESELDVDLDSSFREEDVYDGFIEGDDSSDVDDEDDDKQENTEHEDLSSMKLLELRALAKSRGLKGYSKMKKSELVELLCGSSG